MSNNVMGIMIILAIGLGIFIYLKICEKFKIPKLNCVNLVTGGVKCR